MRTKENRKIPANHITVSDFAKTVYNRRGNPITPSYLYRLIKEGRINEKGVKTVDYGGEILLIKL